MSDYAYLSEVWVSTNKIKKSDPNCGLLAKEKGGLDDIMDAYIGHKNAACQSPSNAVVPYCDDGVVSKPESKYEPDGYNVDSLNQYYPLSKYYGDGLAAMPPVSKPALHVPGGLISKEDVSCSLGTLQEAPEKHDIYKNIVEKYGNYGQMQGQMPMQVSTTTTDKYVELVIYMISGIFLIFMMEQILLIGKAFH
jgi:hypothetical protein